MRVGSLFSGIGGLELALATAGHHPAWFVENDPWARAVLAQHYPWQPNYDDITAVDWNEVEAVDILAGGFPCQDISNAGKRVGIGGEKSGLWKQFVRAVGDLRPRWVFVENVGALRGRGLDVVLGDLALLGFDAEWSTLRASAIGACHRRDRLFVVATNTSRERFDRRGPSGSSRRDESADGGEPAANPSGVGRQERSRVHALRGETAQPEPTDHPGAVADPGGERREWWPGVQGGRRQETIGGQTSDHAGDCGGKTSPYLERFGDYAPAIERWAVIHGETPDPLCDGRLSADFVEWMMGYPPGWTDYGAPKTQRLKMLGNAVVPHQAAAAWELLGGPIG